MTDQTTTHCGICGDPIGGAAIYVKHPDARNPMHSDCVRSLKVEPTDDGRLVARLGVSEPTKRKLVKGLVRDALEVAEVRGLRTSFNLSRTEVGFTITITARAR